MSNFSNNVLVFLTTDSALHAFPLFWHFSLAKLASETSINLYFSRWWKWPRIIKIATRNILGEKSSSGRFLPEQENKKTKEAQNLVMEFQRNSLTSEPHQKSIKNKIFVND